MTNNNVVWISKKNKDSKKHYKNTYQNQLMIQKSKWNISIHEYRISNNKYKTKSWKWKEKKRKTNLQDDFFSKKNINIVIDWSSPGQQKLTCYMHEKEHETVIII